VSVQFRRGTRYWIVSAPLVSDANFRGSVGCISVPANANLEVRLLGPVQVQAPAPILSAWVSFNSGAANQCGPSCPLVNLTVGPIGCIDGRFQSGACASTGDTLNGTLMFLRDGRVFATRSGNLCDAPYYTIMVPPGNGPVVVLDDRGSQMTFSPPSTWPSGCYAVGPRAGAGGTLNARLSARVSSSIASAPARATDPGSAFVLDLDGSQSQSNIDGYEWSVYEIADGGESLVWVDATTAPNASLRLDAGRYRAQLRVYTGHRLVATAWTTTDVGANNGPPAGTLQLTIIGNGTVTAQGSTFSCTGNGGTTTCPPLTGPTSVLLEARNPDGSPNHGAWAGYPNADGYQAFVDLSGAGVSMTANF
jgi:hypothetical protein